jgi:hypothetical protein
VLERVKRFRLPPVNVFLSPSQPSAAGVSIFVQTYESARGKRTRMPHQSSPVQHLGACSVIRNVVTIRDEQVPLVRKVLSSYACCSLEGRVGDPNVVETLQ